SIPLLNPVSPLTSTGLEVVADSISLRSGQSLSFGPLVIKDDSPLVVFEYLVLLKFMVPKFPDVVRSGNIVVSSRFSGPLLTALLPVFCGSTAKLSVMVMVDPLAVVTVPGPVAASNAFHSST